MHILFDLRTVDALPTADRVYLLSLVDGLLPALEARDKVTVLLFKGHPLPWTPIEHPNVTYREALHHGRSWAGIREMKQIAREIRPTVYWSADPLLRPPKFPRRLRVVFAAEELLHFHDKSRFSLLERIKWAILAKPRLLAAHALVCPCRAQEVRMIAALGLSTRRKAHIIHNGVHLIFRHHSEAEVLAVRRRWLIPKRYAILVARAEGHHNLETVFKALSCSEEVSSIPCVIVGEAPPTSAMRDLVHEYHLEGMVRHISSKKLPPADLAALYSGAAVTLEPTLFANYCPPIPQSMACGTPVICAATPANKELFGNAVLRVHPTDAAEWAKAFSALTLSTSLRERLIERGKACVAELTWTATAKASMALARKLCGEATR